MRAGLISARWNTEEEPGAIASFRRVCYGIEVLSLLASQTASMQIDSHIALPEASAVMGSVVLVVRRSNGVDGSIDVIDQIDGFVGRMSSKKARRQSFGRFGPLARRTAYGMNVCCSTHQHSRWQGWKNDKSARLALSLSVLCTNRIVNSQG